jgi:transposase InsO family protein
VDRYRRDNCDLLPLVVRRRNECPEPKLIDRSTFRTHDTARAAIVDFIEGFYNTRRRHSSIGYCSPVQFEKRQAVVA